MAWQLYQGDALETLKQMEDESINCCVTSPPYWGLRDYGAEGQLGVEPTPEEYVAKMVEVFREVKRVLRKDGTLWLNMGDCYASKPPGCDGVSYSSGLHGAQGDTKYRETLAKSVGTKRNTVVGNLKPKDLVGIPWRLAFALQADGWYLRSDIIWSKGNPMPESVTDRPTKAHEYIFLLSKSARYFYDAEAIKEEAKEWTGQAATFKREGGKATQLHVPGQARVSHRPDRKQDQVHRRYTGFNDRYKQGSKRNKRTVWNINTKPFPEAHFAVFPPEIPEICIKAGCPVDGTVLDPFAGSGTTLWVAEQLDRNSIGIELNPEYCDIIRRRMAGLEVNLFLAK
jgi:DNA modification methylase